MDPRAQELLDFWLNEVGEEGWYRQDEALDARIRDRWQATWEEARAGSLGEWMVDPKSTLALLVLLDQFPRNMFRGSPLSFATDGRALAAAKNAILRGWDRRVPVPERQFFYTPLMHSEVQVEQDKSVRMFLLSFGRGESLRHARAHRDIIRRFGRFPFRNAVLGRASAPEEVAFLEAGAYRAAYQATPP